MSVCTNPECVGESELLAAELDGFDEGYDAGFEAALETIDDEPEVDVEEAFDEGYQEALADVHAALTNLQNEAGYSPEDSHGLEAAIRVVEEAIQ